MNVAGWIYNNAWIKVFSADIEANSRFGNTPFDHIVKIEIQCDLEGSVEEKASRCILEVVDGFFNTFGIDMKNSLSTLIEDDVTLDGKPVGISLNGTSFSNILGEDNNVLIDNDRCAQVAVLDEKYLLISMSSYSFWNEITEFLRENFNCINLGGYLLKIGVYPAIDKIFKDIL